MLGAVSRSHHKVLVVEGDQVAEQVGQLGPTLGTDPDITPHDDPVADIRRVEHVVSSQLGNSLVSPTHLGILGLVPAAGNRGRLRPRSESESFGEDNR